MRLLVNLRLIWACIFFSSFVLILTASSIQASDKYVLSTEQMSFWKKNGYLILRDFLNIKEEKDMLLTLTKRLEELPDTPGKWMKYYEAKEDGTKMLSRIEYFIDYEPWFKTLLSGDKMLELVSNLMGEKACLYKEKINLKYPNGKGFKPHQDAPAFITFGQNYHITMMIAIDNSTMANGCLQVAIDNKYSDMLLPTNNDGSIAEEYLRHITWIPVEMQPGDVLLFHSYLPHYSEANKSINSRRALYVTYNRFSEGGDKRQAYFKAKREAFPPDIERDPNKDYSKGASIYNVANPFPK